MSKAIEINNLGKQYRRKELGGSRYQTLRDALWPKGGRKTDKALDYFWALRNVDLSIEQGSIVGVIGPNGAGKSTLLKLLSRVTSPTEGSFTLRGRVASLLEVGTGFHPELTGRENIFLSGAVMGMRRSEIQRRFDEIVAFSGVENFLDLPVKRYSSGMYVRLGFAIAAHLEAEILLVDEVLAVGDAEFQKKCLGKIGDVAQGGRTVLFVSHNLGVINKLCEKSILVKDGALFKYSFSNEVIDEYLGNLQMDNVNIKRTSTLFDNMKISSIECVSNDLDTLQRTIPYGESIFLKIKIQVFSGQEKIHFIIGVNSPISGRICTLSSIEDKIDPLVTKKGEYFIYVEIPAIKLSPGVYSVQVAAVKDFSIRYDIVDVENCFEISSIGINDDYFKGYWGTFMIAGNWSFYD